MMELQILSFEGAEDALGLNASYCTGTCCGCAVKEWFDIGTFSESKSWEGSDGVKSKRSTIAGAAVVFTGLLP
jgi:hypothetical protein